MKKSTLISVKIICSCFIITTAIPSCKHYGENDIPVGPENLTKAGEVYNPDTIGLSSAGYNPADTVNHDKTQMQPANSKRSR